MMEIIEKGRKWLIERLGGYTSQFPKLEPPIVNVNRVNVEKIRAVIKVPEAAEITAERVNWELARQIGDAIITGGFAEINEDIVDDPVFRYRDKMIYADVEVCRKGT